MHIGILILSFQTFDFWPYFCKLCNFDLILPNIEMLVLCFINIGIMISSFQLLEFWPYFCEDCYSHLFFSNIGLLALPLRLGNSDLHPSKLCNSGPYLILPNMGIVVFFLQRLEFCSYPSNYWNSGSIFINTGILILSFETSEFWSCFYKYWNCDLVCLLQSGGQ